jgi:DHA1 family bicyclomycin/chloramphenicol resistance-like MFS transporter
MPIKLPFLTLLLLISFASVNAVLFTPALPDITHFFGITEDKAQQTITWFLVGYALGQLLYGPIAKRFGRKYALYAGISLQIISSLLCVLSEIIHLYGLLVAARFMLALGSGVGLKITFTLVNECYVPKVASQKIAYLMLAFAITPGLSVAVGGFLNTYWGFMSCFYAGAIYGLLLLLLITRIPETLQTPDVNALRMRHLLNAYRDQFTNTRLILGGLLMGGSTAFIYVFATLAPFISIDLFGMSSHSYGLANCLPAFGLLLGSLACAELSQKYAFTTLIQAGIWIAGFFVALMYILTAAGMPLLVSMFLPMMGTYFGLCFILANASVLAMSGIEDKAHGAAVMSFINMGFATLAVFSLGLFQVKIMVLPFIYFIIIIIMAGLFHLIRSRTLP